MSISEPFIRRPVATSLLMVGLMLVGLVAFRELPVAPLPQVDYPTIVVSTALPGASAETMASSVTTPLERQLGQMPGLAQMTSLSSYGTSQITLQFSLDRPIGAAEQDVQAALNAAANLLPRTLPSPPTYSRSNPADTPVLTLAVSSSTLSLSQVDDQADSILAQKISQVVGVGLVTLNGRQKPAVRVQADPESLAGAGLTLEDLRAALAAANVHQPTGSLDGPRQSYTLTTNDQLASANGYRSLILAWRDGAPVRLRDVANVVDAAENDQLAGWADGRRAVILNVLRQPGANIIEVTDRIKELLPQLRASLPQGVEVQIVADRTETIRASVEDVEFTLGLTIALVVLVIFLFLRSLRATVIPGVAVPLSLVGTFAVMWALGYSLNNLSLMALTISTGFVVDDAIVVTENIARFIEEGDDPFEAALKGARQIGFTIISITASLLAVFIPVLLMGGMIGRLFREFAVTLSVAIAISAVVSLTVTPSMCARLLKPEAGQTHGWLYRVSERAFEATLAGYDAALRRVLQHRKLTLLATLGAVAATVYLAAVVPKGLFPQQDTGQLMGFAEAPQDISFPAMRDRLERASLAVARDPDVGHAVSFVGRGGAGGGNSGTLFVGLKERPPRTTSADAVIARLRRALGRTPGLTVFMQAVQDVRMGGRSSRTQFQYTLEDADLNELREWAPRLLQALRRVPELRDVNSDQENAGLSLDIEVDRDAAARLGVSMAAIDGTLADAFAQRQVAITHTELNHYRVILEAPPSMRQDPGALSNVYVRGRDGLVPLTAIARASIGRLPLSVNHQGQFPAVTLSFNLAPGKALGDAVEAIHAAEARIGVPASLRARFRGTAQAFQESLASQPYLIAAALIAVYLVLGMLYESLVHPITILSTLPTAGVGAFAALLLTNTEFSIIALVGIILLIGIVKKNAIMMIDFAIEAERDEGLSPVEAIHKASVMRFRPIMMTTMAALLGALPLALGSGTGSELRRPLGITIVGGLLVSQALTLFTTPVIYLALDRFTKRRPAHGEAASKDA
ncbi:MAG: multidrug efflux RND transporter permease subunit [Polyangiales bacterium]